MSFDVEAALQKAQNAEKIATAIYEKLLPQLSAKKLGGKYIAIKVPSGEYLIASTRLEILDLCDKHGWGDAPAWVQQIENGELEQHDRSGRPS